MNIEPLESRIAPAAVFTYTDVDGDLITITSSKGADADLTGTGVLLFSNPNPANPRQLQVLDLSVNAAAFAGTSLTISATRGSTGGDGLANVGYIDAFAANGGTALDLGTVSIKGDLGAIDVGDGDTTTAACKSLTVQSLGRYGISTGTSNLTSDFIGALGMLKVKGDVTNAFVHVTGGANGVDGKIGSITVGGSLLGGAIDFGGSIEASGDIGVVKIGGDLQGGSAISSGSIQSDRGKIKSVTVGGSVLGGDGQFTAEIRSGSDMGPVKIGGSVKGGSGATSGYIASFTGFGVDDGDIASITIGGSLVAGASGLEESGGIHSPGKIGVVKIGGDIDGGFGLRSGSIFAAETIASVTVGGSLLGGSRNESGMISSDLTMGTVKISGDIVGGHGDNSGSINAKGTLAGVTVGGSLIGGSGVGSGRLISNDQMGPVKILGDIVGTSITGAESLIGSPSIYAHRLANIFVGGSIRAGVDDSSGSLAGNAAVYASDDIGSITVKGSLIGAAHTDGDPNDGDFTPVIISARGQAVPVGKTDVAIKSLTVGGRVEQTQIIAGVIDNPDAQIGAVKVGGDWIASRIAAGTSPGFDRIPGTDDDSFLGGGNAAIMSKIASITIKGQAFGSVGGTDSFRFMAQKFGSLKVAGTAIPLTAGADNLLVGATGDLRAFDIV